jgi:peptidoglycan/xylan/chitin deacetylase (PgdA/CDA1 family)
MIRNPIPWPNGCRCAAAVTFDMDADSILHIAHHDTAHDRVAAISMLRYGPEVAMPRILDMFRDHGLKQTFFVPSWCIERYPAAVEAALKDGHEIAHHGYLHEQPQDLSAEDELYWFERASDVILRVTGKRPRGYRAPSYRFSHRTLDVLVDAGLAYDASLMGDDIPYVLENGRGSLIELPSHYGMDDWPHFMVSRDFGYMMSIKSPEAGMDVYRAEFDAAWEHGGLWIAVWHPFLSGRLARCAAIAKLIRYMLDKGKVWFAPLEEIAAHVNQTIAAKSWQPRVDRLPYYAGPIPELERGRR